MKQKQKIRSPDRPQREFTRSSGRPSVLQALRLPELYRAVCRFAGLAPNLPPGSGQRFTFRCGAESPQLYCKLLEEAFVEDGAEIVIFQPTDGRDCLKLPPGQVIVQPGFDAPCPDAETLRRVVQNEGGP